MDRINRKLSCKYEIKYEYLEQHVKLFQCFNDEIKLYKLKGQVISIAYLTIWIG